MLAFAKVLFAVPFVGSFWLLMGLEMIYVTTALSIGILISTAVPTQQLAMQFALLITMLPSIMLSGFIFAVKNMPIPLQIVSKIVPATYFLNMVRGIMLKGSGFEILAPQAGFLLHPDGDLPDPGGANALRRGSVDMWRPFIGVIRKEFIQGLRDKNNLRMLFVMPVVQLSVMGYAVNTDVKRLAASMCTITASRLTRGSWWRRSKRATILSRSTASSTAKRFRFGSWKNDSWVRMPRWR